MKKSIFVYSFLFIAIIGLYAQENSRIMYAFAPAGLRVRSAPSVNGEILGILGFLERVEIIREDQNIEIINGRRGNWVHINMPIEGWVFNGHLLSKYDPEFILTFANTSWTSTSAIGEMIFHTFNDTVTELIIDSVRVSSPNPSRDPSRFWHFTMSDDTWQIINYERIPNVEMGWNITLSFFSSSSPENLIFGPSISTRAFVVSGNTLTVSSSMNSHIFIRDS